jgi:hypothetical protein
MMEQQPCSSHPGSLLVYAWQKLEESTIQWDKWNVFYASYFTVMHCHPLSLSVAVVLTLVLAVGLMETAPTNWTHDEKFLLAFFYISWEGCITTVYCY